MADGYTYLPSLGPFLIIGLLAAWGSSKADFAKIFYSAAVFMLFCCVVSNNSVLWNYVIEKEGDRVPLAYNMRGISFYKTVQLDKAISDYDRAIALKPSHYKAHVNKRITYGKAGLFDEAIKSFNQSITVNPNFAEAFINRGITFSLMGQTENALEDYSKALNLIKILQMPTSIAVNFY